MKNTGLTLALIISSVVLAGAIITTATLLTEDRLQVAKSEAVQGCYEVTTGVRRSEKDEAVLEESQINKQTLEECITLKGF
jgi:hypothetical protein